MRDAPRFEEGLIRLLRREFNDEGLVHLLSKDINLRREEHQDGASETIDNGTKLANGTNETSEPNGTGGTDEANKINVNRKDATSGNKADTAEGK